MTVGERLKEIRKAKGYTQKEFAAMLEIEQPKYSKWENGKQGISIDNVRYIAARLDMPVDWLVDPDGSPAPDLRPKLSVYTDSELLHEIQQRMARS